ncbi:MAG TPA: hypothetical protein VFR31_02145, partial [Thermoanaerobaculia bacterium]|nr:hypothetical protein [Thermoanaerobaculia bacterium]
MSPLPARLPSPDALHQVVGITKLSLRRPGAMLAVWAVALVLALPGLARLELRTDGRTLVPPSAPALAEDEAVRRAFGLRDPLLVLVEP